MRNDGLDYLKYIFLANLLISSNYAISVHSKSLLLRESLYRPLITLSLGSDFVTQGQDKRVSLLPPFINYYTNNKHKETIVDGGGFIGFERPITEKSRLQLGLAGYVTDKLNPGGNVWLFGTPLFNALAYQYNIRQSRIVAEGKFLVDFFNYKSINPYASWSLGAAFNKASDYQETPLVAGAVPMQPFNDRTKTNFTWAIGVGIDYQLSQNFRLGLGYQFADFGAVSLGRTPAALTNQTLSFPHLYANQLRFQLSIVK